MVKPANIGQQIGNRLFYYPITISKKTPEDWGYLYKDVFFKSKDGTKLHGWLVPATAGVKKSKGIVVYSHGNTGSVNSHFGFASWLAIAGYNVFLYDYRGFGKSEGAVERKGMIEDVQAAIQYALNIKELKHLPVVSFGHSLGGAKSLVAVALMEKEERLRGVVSWAGFRCYREMALHKAGKWAATMVTDELAAKDYVAKISPLPLLFIHGEKDGVVPVKHGRGLFDLAKEPKKIMLSKDGGHNNAMHWDNKKLQKEMLVWLDETLKGPKAVDK